MKNKTWFPFLLGMIFSLCVILVFFLLSRILVRLPPLPEQIENIGTQETPISIYVDEVEVKRPNRTNGKKLFFILDKEGIYELYSIDIGSQNPIAITNTKSKYMGAVLSPSGNRLVFEISTLHEDIKQERIFLSDPTGSDTTEIPVSSDVRSIDTPIWSPDESRLAFSTSNFNRENSETSSEIYVIQMDNDLVSSTRISLGMIGSDVSYLAWSPDGSTIVFHSGYDIYLIDPASMKIQQLTDALSSRIPANSDEPNWSPSGDRIAFTVHEDYDFDIFIMDSDGSNKVKVANLETLDYSPEWSPSGKYILFFCHKRTYANGSVTIDSSDVCLIDLKTMLVKNLTKQQGDNRPIGWFPFEDRILFTSLLDNHIDDYRSDYRSVDINGENIVKITTSGDARGFIWSPDGSNIAFTTEGSGSGNSSLYIAEADGSNKDKLLTVEGRIIIVGWQPQIP